MIRRLSVLSAVAILAFAFAVNAGLAQDSSAGIPIQFAGRITSIDGTVLTVNRVRIDVSRAEANILIQVNTQIVIRGILMEDGVVVAQTLSIYVPPVPTNVPPPPTVDPASLSVVQPTPYSTTIVGPVQAIGDGFLVVNDMTLPYDSDDPLLAGLQVGDVLEIAANAYDVNGTTAFDITSINLIGRTADLVPTDTPQGMGMGMGMGEGMGD
jgi:hypothetical protein